MTKPQWKTTGITLTNLKSQIAPLQLTKQSKILHARIAL